MDDVVTKSKGVRTWDLYFHFSSASFHKEQILPTMPLI